MRTPLRILTALTLVLVAVSAPQPVQAARRHAPRSFCGPVSIEGVGAVRICAPVRGR